MSKPLELTVHPKRLVDAGFLRVEQDGSFTALRVEEWFIDGAWLREPFRTHKRLTDAELAAEYYAQQIESVEAFDRAYPWGASAELEATNARVLTLERFASLPHYDETP